MGRLLSMPTAAAFSLSDVDDEIILTIVLMCVSPSCSVNSSGNI